MKKRRMTPPRNNLSAGVSGAALNPAKTKMVIPAWGIITPRTVPKTTTSRKIQHRRIEKPALMRERHTDGESEEDNYMPLSEDEVSLGDEEFIVPEDPVEQERFKRRLIATTKSLKKKAAAASS